MSRWPGVLYLLAAAVAVVHAEPLPSAPATDVLMWSESGYTGTIPSQWGLYTDISFVKLTANSLTGSVPTELGHICQTYALVSQLWLDNNALTGTIPTQLGSMTSLHTNLNLKSNMFVGRLPSQLCQLRLTTNIVFGSNSLTGPLPTELGYLTWLRRGFKAGQNLFTGGLPTEVGKLTVLTESFIVKDNLLEGLLPSQVGLLTQLSSEFEGQRNIMSNRLPTELGLMVKMTSQLLLDSNRLTGSIPSQLASLTYFTGGLSLDANKLCGDVPTEVQQMSSYFRAGWNVSAGNDLGTPCCETIPALFTCAPSTAPSVQPTVAPTTAFPTPAPSPGPTPFCGRGQFLSDAISCEPCEAGKFRNSTDNPAVCTLCPAGMYRGYSTHASDALACGDCPEGTLSSSDRTECTKCAAGQFAFNDTSCESCQAGTYAPVALTDACIACSAGFATGVNLAATECLACDAGSFATAEAVNCSSCPAGTYSASRAEACSNCSAGFFSDTEGASACTACAAGFFASNPGAANCSACGVGTHQTATGQSECAACDAGYFMPNRGAAVCFKCSAEVGSAYTSRAGAGHCALCGTGFYDRSSADDDTTECVTCPGGTDCDRVGSMLEGLAVKPGHFRFHSQSRSVYECIRHDLCLGGNSTATQDQCAEGSHGALCATCRRMYFFNPVDGTCHRCDLSRGSFLVRMGGILAVLVVLLLAATAGRRLAAKAWEMYKNDRQRWDDLIALLTAVVVTMQIIVLVEGNHHDLGGEPIQHPYSDFLAIMGFLGLDIFELGFLSDCAVAKTTLYKVSVYFFGPILIFALGAWRVRRAPRCEQVAQLSLFLSGLFLILPMMSRTFCQTFRCSRFDGGEYAFLSVDLSMSCFTPRYHHLALFAGLACLVYPVGVPLTILAWLYKFRHHLDPLDLPEAEALAQRKLDPALALCAVAPFAQSHRPQYWYFEVYNMLRRLLLTSFALVFENPSAMLLFVMAVSIVTTVIHREAQAELSEWLGAFIYVCHWQVQLVIVAMFAADSDTTTKSGTTAVGAVLLVVNVVILFIVLAELERNLRRSSRFTLAEMRQRTSTLFSGLSRRWPSERASASPEPRMSCELTSHGGSVHSALWRPRSQRQSSVESSVDSVGWGKQPRAERLSSAAEASGVRAETFEDERAGQHTKFELDETGESGFVLGETDVAVLDESSEVGMAQPSVTTFTEDV